LRFILHPAIIVICFLYRLFPCLPELSIWTFICRQKIVKSICIELRMTFLNVVFILMNLLKSLDWTAFSDTTFRVVDRTQFMVNWGTLTLGFNCLIFCCKLWFPITGDNIWEATIHFNKILKTRDHMFGFGPSELIYPNEARSPVYTDKKVNLLAIAEGLLG